MKSIEQLHREIQILNDNNIDTEGLVRISDAIEREVEEGYVKLPRDASGEPITYDTMTEQWGALDSIWCMMESDGSCTWYVRGHDMSAPIMKASEVTVVKPPTVEDVLEDYRVKYYDLVTDMECKNITNEEYVQGIKELASEFAAKLQIREAR